MRLFRVPPNGKDDERFIDLDAICTARFESGVEFGRKYYKLIVSFHIGETEYDDEQADVVVTKLRQIAADQEKLESLPVRMKEVNDGL